MSGTRTVSVLIPSWRRPDALERCLRALAVQTQLPDQVVVVWQADDVPTRARAELLRKALPFRLDVLHAAEAGIVPAENLALDHATSGVVALIDDDAVAPPGWVARVLGHFDDPTVGAVGGPADNVHPDGRRFDHHPAEPVGQLPWHGYPVGNMYDQPPDWRERQPAEVVHLVGYNMALRRCAFGRFESRLRRYWQLFELEACLQVRARGYRVVFDYGNVVGHHPTNAAYVSGRGGDLSVKVFNAAYNLGFVLARHSPWPLIPVRLAYQLLVGRVNTPGLLACPVAVRRYGRPVREAGILARTWVASLAGWKDGLWNRVRGDR